MIAQNLERTACVECCKRRSVYEGNCSAKGCGFTSNHFAAEQSRRADALPNESEPNAERWGTAALEQRRQRTRNHLAQIAAHRESWINRNSYYYALLKLLLRFLIDL